MAAKPPRYIRCCLLLWLAALMLSLGSIGMAQESESQLQRGRFSITYPKGLDAVAERTLTILEAATAEFEPRLPLGDTPVRVIVVDAPETFRKYAARFEGLDVSGIARPGEALIVVKAPRLQRPGADYPGTLRHELVHLLLHRNVNPAYIPQWFEEGLAMSLANEYYWQGMFSVARMFLENRIIPYHQLDRAFFIPEGQEQFGDAYAQGLSMVRFLRNRLGEETFWRVTLAMRALPFADALARESDLDIHAFWALYERALWKYAAIAAMASGLFFQPAAILVILAYLRRRRIAKALYKKWEAEERAERLAPVRQRTMRVFRWEEVVEDPDAWKGGAESDDD